MLEDRLIVMARRRRKVKIMPKSLWQHRLHKKSNFMAIKFLTTLIESMESNDIVLNIVALVDRRVGKKRILSMAKRWC